jgi:transposase
MRRHELTEAQFEAIRRLLPQGGGRGRRWRDHLDVLNGLSWRLRTGCPWRDIPERYGPWSTIYGRFRRWSRDGTLDRVLKALQMRLDEEGRVDWELFCIDGTSIRAGRAAAGGGKKGARTSPRTTLWAARAADSGPRSTWSLTVADFPSRPR